MRTVEAHLLEDKMDEAVTHYINSHHPNEPVHIDTNGIPMTVQDDGAGRVTIMHQQTYTTQMCRQVSVTEQVGEGPWGEELLEGPIAAIVAHLQNSRHHPPPLHKVSQVRSDVDTSVIMDSTMRFNGQTLDHQTEPIVVQLPPMQTLPPLQDMKRCDNNWFSDKSKKDEQSMLQDSDSQVLEMASSSPAQHKQQNRKSLPHKKRISRKLKRNNGNSTPQQDQLVVINCTEAVQVPPEQEQILPDNYVTVPHAAHISHEVRPVLICQICGEYYGEEQLKFYHHLKQHYEPHHTIIIENPVPDLPCDKMSANCIVDNVATLPDSIVELSLENTVPKPIYQPMDKHILYTSSDRTLTYNSNKMQYSMVSMDKEPPTDVDKTDLYETLDKLRIELYSCNKCSKTFRKQKHYEAHMREAHPISTKCEDMGEFSEPEDLMAGIQVCVGGEYETGAGGGAVTGGPHQLLPHLTVDNGHVTQEHANAWFGRGASHGSSHGASACGGYCGVCCREPDTSYKLLKEEVLQRILDSEDNANFADNMISDHDVGDQDHNHDHEHENNEHSQGHNDHGHEQSERSHGHNDHHMPNEHTQIHNDHILHSEHSQHSQGHTDHSDLSQGHNEHNHNQGSGHEQNDQGQEHNETSQDHYEVVKQEHTKNKSKQFFCKKCDRVFSHRNSLIYHVLSHQGKQHTCKECGKEFYTHGALKIHRRVHNNVRPYKCDVCGREFRQRSDLKYHKISLHSDQKPFKCEYCGKEFSRKYSLNLHVRIHTKEKNYKCDYCSKAFTCSSYKLTHMRTHTGDRPYKCDECEKCFRSAFDMRRHALVHDKVRNRFDEHRAKPKDNQKKTKMTDTKEEKVEQIELLEPSPKKIKLIAVASTTRQGVLMKKQQKPSKKSHKKVVPNVTIQVKEAQFKINDEFANNVEVYDDEYQRRVEYGKIKNIYTDRSQIFKDEQNQQRDLAVLRPIGHRAELEEKVPYRAENTDGKMQVFTHVEKGKDYNGSIVPNTQALGDMRHLDRDVTREVRSEIPGEGIETGFLERLTAMYNIPAV